MRVPRLIKVGKVDYVEKLICPRSEDPDFVSSVIGACDLSPNMKYVWELTVQGGECSNKTFSLKVESLTTKKWDVRVIIQTEVATRVAYLIHLSHSDNVISGLTLAHRHPEGPPIQELVLVCDIFAKSCETGNERTLNLERNQNGFIELFNTKKFWDIKLIVQGNELLAHKCVLGSSGKVFAAMLEPDTEEAKSNKIYIDDVDTETVTEMLRFLYTGNVSNGCKLANKLLVASDKFDLEALRTFSGIELAKNISVNNAAETLILAHLHDLENLKNHTSYFIKNNLMAVTNTEGWNSVKEKYSDVIARFLN